MLNSLDSLIIVFIGMAAASVLGIILQFVLKNEKLQKAAFYFSAVLGVLLAYFKTQSTPLYGDYTGQIVVGLALGVLAIAAVVFQLVKKDEKSFKLAKVLATVSVIGGMISTFCI